MPAGLTGMLNMGRLNDLFTRAANGDQEALSELRQMNEAQGMTSLGTPQAAPDMGPDMGSATSSQSPMITGPTPEENRMHLAESAAQPQGRDWSRILSIASLGLTDLGNAVGNPRAPVGGAIYDQIRNRFATEQQDMLRRRQGMWDDAYKQAQELPSDILTDPKFAPLAQAKANLDKDLADGKIDNEKNVSGFLTEMARFKKDLEDLSLETKTRQQLELEERVAEGRREQAEAQRKALEAREAAGDPEAARQLAVLRAQDMSTRQVGDRDVTMTGSDWAKHDVQSEEQRARDEREADLRLRLGRMAYSQRSDQDSARQRAQTANRLRMQLESARDNYAQHTDPTTGEKLPEEEILARSLMDNQEGIIAAATRNGVKIEFPPDDITVSPRIWKIDDIEFTEPEQNPGESGDEYRSRLMRWQAQMLQRIAGLTMF